MRRIHGLFLLIALLGLWSTPAAAQSAEVAGHWEGTISMPNQPVPVAVEIAKNAAGSWIGSMSIPGSVSDVPMTRIAVEGPSVRFTVALPDTPSFAGSLSADASELAGDASNSQGSVPFQLKRKGEASVKLPPPSSASSSKFEGIWEGTISSEGKSRRIDLKLTPAADGTATAVLVSVERGNTQIPVTTVTLKENELRLDVRGAGGSYRGTLGANGEITGEWLERGTPLSLIFKRATPSR